MLTCVRPGREATSRYLENMGLSLQVVFDVDLGELVRGHHVIARGIDLGHPTKLYQWMVDETQARLPAAERDWTVVGTRPSGAALHYEFVPGLEAWERDREPFFWYWKLHVSDDAETAYSEANTGSLAPAEGGPATHGIRDLGGEISEAATRLFIEFRPPPKWIPPEPWRRQLVIDLADRTVIESL